MTRRSTGVLAGGLLALLLAGCGDGDSTGPDTQAYRVAIQGGDGQFAQPGGLLGEPLRVVVSKAGSEEPADGVSVSWSLIEGAGATITIPSSATDDQGIARTQLRLGSALGRYRVRATVQGGKSTDSPVFEARAVVAPQVTGIAPATPSAGDTVTVSGRGFGPAVDDNTVSFDGVPATVLSSTSTELRVAVPACIPTRTVDLVVQLGAVASNALEVPVLGDAPAPLRIAPGSLATAGSPAELACMRLALQDSGAEYLLVIQNAAEVSWQETPFQLVGLAEPGLAASSGFIMQQAEPTASTRGTTPGGEELESLVRLREQLISPDSVLRPRLDAAGLVQPPSVGDRRDFNVLTRKGSFQKVTAVVKHVSKHAVLYQDLNAPAGGFGDADFARFGSLFDDPIYPTDVSVYGAPSDVDGNGHVVILFTPVVNSWTRPGAGASSRASSTPWT